MSGSTAWWQPQPINEGEWAWWRLSGLSVWVGRTAEGWTVASASSLDADPNLSELSRGEGSSPPEIHEVERFATPRSAGPLQLLPTHADRPVIARPERPLTLPPRTNARLFVSLPLWVRLSAGDTLLDRPVLRPPDTWLGTTTEGTLCYAMRTPLRSELQSFDRSPHHALATVVVRNESDDALRLERLRIPAPALSIFGDQHGGLWTEEVHLTRKHGAAFAQVRVMPGPASAAPETTRLSEPRQPHEENVMIRAFNSVFS